jgi:hypothetical protein
MPETPTLRQLNRALLARQMLLAREPTTVVKTIARLGGVQAQLARPPFIGLAARLEGFTRAHLLDAIRDKRVVRATWLRGTLHLVTTADYLAFRGALQPALDRGLSVLGAKAKQLDREAVRKTASEFFGRRPAPFEAFRDQLARNWPAGEVRGVAYASRLFVPLVQVPADDAEWGYPGAAEFTLADRWLDKPVPMKAGSLAPLITRYLGAFGPATVADAQAWSGLPGLAPVFESLRPSLVTFLDERKRELFDLPDAPRPDADTPAPVRLLPEFDNVILGHKDRARIIADAHRPMVTTKNLQVRATFLVDGFVAGTWRMETKKGRPSLQLEPFGRLPKAVVKALEEIERTEL